MSTKRPSITVLSDLIQKYVGSDYDKILEAANTIEQFLNTSTSGSGQTSGGQVTISTNLNTEVNYEDSAAETLDQLLQELITQVSNNTEIVAGVDDLNSAVALNSSSVLAINEQLEQFINNVLSGKTYAGGYDPVTNTPNLTAPPIDTVQQGNVYDVIVDGDFAPVLGSNNPANNPITPISMTVGDTLRAKVTNPIYIEDWVYIPYDLNAVSIKTQYESNADTNAFTDADETKLDGIETGAQVNAETLQSAYDGGYTIEISGTNFPVTIDQTLSTSPGIRLIPNSTFPTSNVLHGSIHADTDGTFYAFDETRLKWLSLFEMPYHFTKEGRISEDQDTYLNIVTLVDTVVGYVVPRNATIVGIRARGRSIKEFGSVPVNTQFSIRKKPPGDPLEEIGTFSLVNNNYDDTTTNIDISEDDELKIVALEPTSDSRITRNCLVSVYLKWRK